MTLAQTLVLVGVVILAPEMGSRGRVLIGTAAGCWGLLIAFIDLITR